jgi:hypothetical protein
LTNGGKVTLSRSVVVVGILGLLLLLTVLLLRPTTWPAGISNAIWAPDPKEDVGPLYGIAGVAPNDVWAVGRTASEPHKALIAHWDGRQWGVTERISVIPRNHVLKDIVALSKNDIWAVGSYESGGEPPNVTTTPLTLHWNGLTWEHVRVHVEGNTNAYLSAIEATKEGTLWAVGSVVLRWNGSSWDQILTPEGDHGFPEAYNDVAAISDDDTWVVGNRTIRHWDGTAWRQLLNSGEVMATDFTAVKVISDSDIWVAGQYHIMGGMTYTRFQVLHWDGVNWEAATRPPIPGTATTPGFPAFACMSLVQPCYLMKFAARSANDIWLVGDAGQIPLMSHWDGARWQGDPCPTGEPPGSLGIMPGMGGSGALYDVAILAPDKIWAVGSRTFTEDNRYAYYGYVHSVLHGPCPTPEPTATRPPTPTFDTRPWPTLPLPEQTAYPVPPAGPGTMVLPIPTFAVP